MYRPTPKRNLIHSNIYRVSALSLSLGLRLPCFDWTIYLHVSSARDGNGRREKQIIARPFHIENMLIMDGDSGFVEFRHGLLSRSTDRLPHAKITRAKRAGKISFGSAHKAKKNNENKERKKESAAFTPGFFFSFFKFYFGHWAPSAPSAKCYWIRRPTKKKSENLSPLNSKSPRHYSIVLLDLFSICLKYKKKGEKKCENETNRLGGKHVTGILEFSLFWLGLCLAMRRRPRASSVPPESSRKCA